MEKKEKKISQEKYREHLHKNTLWNKSLTTKLVYSYEISPILAIKDSFLRDEVLKEQYKHYDPLAIGLKMLELIIDNMGPYTGITKNELFEEITPLLKRMDEVKSIKPFKRTDHIKILEYILEKLVFQSRSKGIRLKYTDYSQYPPKEKEIAYRLITYRTYDNKSIVLHAEPVAVNFFLQMLNIELEDQQKAYLYLLKRQIKRGDYENALESAKNNLRLTNQYELRLDAIIRKTRRNLTEMDWFNAIPRELRKAMDHLNDCVKKQEYQNHKINAQLQNIDENITQRGVLLELKEILERSRDRILPLQNKVNEAIETFLEEQWVQELSLKKTNRLSIEEDLLNHFLKLRYGDFKEDIDSFIPFFSKIKIPKILSYDQLIELILKGIKSRSSIKIPEKHLITVPIEIVNLNLFSDIIRKDAVEFLNNHLYNNGHVSTLDKIIECALKEKKSFLICNYLRLLIQGRYANNEFEKRYQEKEISVSLLNENLKNLLFFGVNFEIILEEEV